ncbi:ATP-dependent nuclease [Desulfogranum japonicum]|uniref:ATP-dependent nuclease n=1 Tax=Desulfogranum japonicum TaxID=231447 RepID=UPI0003F6523A|nr:DUF2813 domain-containing protein [Desulfogranum japonicum]
MELVEISIENFRGIRSLLLPFEDLTVLIGENNTGKSTVLEALRLILTRGFSARKDARFTEYDFHLKDAVATPQTADPISIVLHFAEKQEDDWPDPIVQQMSEVIQFDQDGIQHIWLQAKGSYLTESGSFETSWAFLDSSGAELILKNATPLNLITRFVPLFFLSAIRNASQEFSQRGQFWSGFLKSIELPDEERDRIEEMLQEVNTKVIGANEGLTEVTNRIAEAKRLVPLDSSDPVVLEAIPTRVFDMVGKIQVHLKSSYGAKLPLHRHGEGTQSLAVLMLFQAFTAANLAEAYTPESTPLLALEEPEAHLHPSAIRSLGSFFESMTGQIIVTSHSGDLISKVPILSLRRLYKVNGETKIGRVETGTFSDRELQAIDYTIRLTRGHYLFSRCWLLVEGESDYHLMPLIFDILGYSQDQISFSILEISQVINKGEPLIKFAKSLGVQWFLMADGDSAGNDYVARANNYLEIGENLADRARTLTYPDVEHEFWNNGYQAFIENMVTATRKRQIASEAAGDAAKETKLLIKAAIKNAGGKPAFAQALATEIRRRGIDEIPQTIKDIITRVVQLAGD